eukprot:g2915.t1
MCASDELRKDREIVLAAVKNNGMALMYASDELRKDRKIMVEAMKNNEMASMYADELRKEMETVNNNGLYYASYGLRNDRYIVMEAVKNNGLDLQYASKELQKDREIVLAAVKNNGMALEYASYGLREDREITMEAVKNNGMALKYASYGLQMDREIVLAAVKNNGMALEYASDELRKDREITMEAVKNNGMALKYASYGLQMDREIVLAAVKNNGMALEYASDELRKDREITMEAVKNNGMALKYASYGPRKDREIVLAAVKNNGMASMYASDELRKELAAVNKNGLYYASYGLRNDRYIVMEAVKNNGLDLQYASKELQKDREIVLAAVKNNGMALEYASYGLREDREITMEAVKNNGKALKYASEKLRENRNIVLAAVGNDATALKYAHDELKKDPNVLLAAAIQKHYGHYAAIQKHYGRYESVDARLRLKKDGMCLRKIEQNGYALQYIMDDSKNEGKFTLAAQHQNNTENDQKPELIKIKENAQALADVSLELKSNREFIRKVLQENVMALKYALKKFKGDHEIVLEAVKLNGYALEYASQECQKHQQIVLEAAKQNRYAAEKHAHCDVWNDENIVLGLVKIDGGYLRKANNALRADCNILHQQLKGKSVQLLHLYEEYTQKNEKFKESGDGSDEDLVVKILKDILVKMLKDIYNLEPEYLAVLETLNELLQSLEENRTQGNHEQRLKRDAKRYALGILWWRVFENEEEHKDIKEEISSYNKTTNKDVDHVKRQFLAEYAAISKMQEETHSFLNEERKPNLMQCATAVLLYGVSYPDSEEQEMSSVFERDGLLNCSETGTGKTDAGILTMNYAHLKIKGTISVLVVVPGEEVAAQWQRRVKGFFPDDSSVLIHSCNQDIHKETLCKTQFSLIILDEIHKVKDASRSQECKVLGMTATPLATKTKDLWSLFEFLHRKEFKEPEDDEVASWFGFVYLTMDSIRAKKKSKRKVKFSVAVFQSNKCECDCKCKTCQNRSGRSTVAAELQAVGGVQPMGEVELAEQPDHEKCKKMESRLQILKDNEYLPFYKESKMLVYSHYTGLNGQNECLIDMLKDGMEPSNYTVYTGSTDKVNVRAVDSFKKTKTIIASRPILEGVDGLQYNCNNIMIAILPHTIEQWDQLRGRLDRQGQPEGTINMFIPVVLQPGESASADVRAIFRLVKRKRSSQSAVENKCVNLPEWCKEDWFTKSNGYDDLSKALQGDCAETRVQQLLELLVTDGVRLEGGNGVAIDLSGQENQGRKRKREEGTLRINDLIRTKRKKTGEKSEKNQSGKSKIKRKRRKRQKMMNDEAFRIYLKLRRAKRYFYYKDYPFHNS